MNKDFSIRNIKSKVLNAQTIRIAFIVILVILIGAFFLQVFFTHGALTRGIFFQDTNDTFMDFFKVQGSIASMAPVSEGIYPPLSYIVMLPFNRFVDYNAVDPFSARDMQLGIMSLVIYLVFWMLIAGIFLSMMMKKQRGLNVLIVFLLFLSAPMIFLFERGNINIAVLAFLAIFFACYEDKKPVVREIAIIALAVATGIKLYPALFGLLLLKKDSVFRFLRLAAYCVLLIILPVFFFDGGLDNIKKMVQNILSFSDTLAGWPDSPALRSILGFGAMFRAGSIKFGIGQDWYQQAAQITSYIMLAGSIIGSFFVNKKWKKAALLACPIVLFPAMSGIYNIVYFFVPILFFLEEEKREWTDYLYMLLFIVMLNPYQFGDWIPMVAKTTILTNICSVLLNSFLCLEALIGLVKFVSLKIKSKAKVTLGEFEPKLVEPDFVNESAEEIQE